jgi:hypothetical protein
MVPLFFIMIFLLHTSTFISSTHSTVAICRKPFPSHGKPSRGAEPRIELGLVLQKADALPTELRPTLSELGRTLMSYAAPY